MASLSGSCSAGFLNTVQANLLRDAAAHSGLGPPTAAINQDNLSALNTSLIEVPSSQGLWIVSIDSKNQPVGHKNITCSSLQGGWAIKSQRTFFFFSIYFMSYGGGLYFLNFDLKRKIAAKCGSVYL